MEASLQVNHINVAVLELFVHTTILFLSNSYAFGSMPLVLCLWFYAFGSIEPKRCPALLGRQTKSGILCSMNKMFYELIYPIHPVLNVLLLVHRTVSFVKPARRLGL